MLLCLSGRRVWRDREKKKSKKKKKKKKKESTGEGLTALVLIPKKLLRGSTMPNHIVQNVFFTDIDDISFALQIFIYLGCLVGSVK